MSRSTGILCDWLNNSQTRYSPIRVFPQQLSNRQIGSSSNIKLRVQEGLNELGIVLLCVVVDSCQFRIKWRVELTWLARKSSSSVCPWKHHDVLSVNSKLESIMMQSVHKSYLVGAWKMQVRRPLFMLLSLLILNIIASWLFIIQDRSLIASSK